MVNESVLRSLFKALDAAESAVPAVNALNKILEDVGERAPATAAKLAEFVADLKTPEGAQHALGVLTPYGPNVPEALEAALALSHLEEPSVRLSAASFLAAAATNVKANARIFELLEDPDAKVRNVAINATGTMDHTGGIAGAASVLYVIPEEGQRKEVIGLLDRLERAVKTLQDLGLDDGQNQIVNDLILPDIGDLKKLLGAESPDVNAVISERKRSMVTLGHALGAAKAFALGTAGVAAADEAAANVKSAADMLSPLLDLLKGLV